MEKLHISSSKARELLLEGGNGVLLLTYPTVRGETPAACHAAALVEALADYARKDARKLAAGALRAALAAGRVFDFTRHTYDISLVAVQEKKRLVLTLTAHFFAGEQTLTKHTLVSCWSEDERLQQPRPRRRTYTFKRNV